MINLTPLLSINEEMMGSSPKQRMNEVSKITAGSEYEILSDAKALHDFKIFHFFPPSYELCLVEPDK